MIEGKWKIDLTPAQSDSLWELLNFAISELNTCSKSNSFEGLARRISKAHFEQIRAQIASVTE